MVIQPLNLRGATMENEELRKLQLYQLDILKEVDRICQKHHIKYYISWGSLLGAVRHKGFIPWDDDIDISLFWDDYVKFMEVCQEELDERFFLQNPETDSGYFRPWAKVRINDTTSMDKELDFVKMHWGICIDVFPIISIPTKKSKQHYQKVLIILYQIMCFEPLIRSMVKDNKSLKGYIRACLYIPYIGFSIIPSKLKRAVKKRILQKIIDLQEKKSPLCGEALSMNYEKSIVPTQMYGEPVRVEFEGQEFNAPEKYIDYLTNFYGDFMKLPKESERTGHGDTIISFEYQANK